MTGSERSLRGADASQWGWRLNSEVRKVADWLTWPVLLPTERRILVAKQPLAEVFGFPIDNQSEEAKRFRNNRLCPFGNRVPNCTKDKANDPLGTCSIFADGGTVITCPVRFREEWTIAVHAAEFFFPPTSRWTSLTEVRLKDAHGSSAGNIDVVLVSYDDRGSVLDFGALEVQSVYISGNIRNPFSFYMQDPAANAKFDWSRQPNYPGPDYLSSSRKRLAPQLLFKGGILNAWRKRSAVALDRAFFDTLPTLDEVEPAQAEIAWLVYDLELNEESNRYRLTKLRTVYTKFSESLQQITVSKPGEIEPFLEVLQTKLDDKLSGTDSPANITLDELL